MDPGQYEVFWNEYNKRMDPEKYNKFAQCFQRLIEGTNVKDAVSMVTVGIGKCIYTFRSMTHVNILGLSLVFDNLKRLQKNCQNYSHP